MNKKEDRILDHRGLFHGQKPESMEGGLRELTRRYKETSQRVSEDIEETVVSVAAVQTNVDKKSAQMDEHQRTATGSAFNSATPTWTDIPDGAGSVQQILTTKGGAVRVEAVLTYVCLGNLWVKLRLLEDGVAGNIVVSNENGNAQDQTLPIKENFAPAAGLHTYKLQGQTETGASITLNHASLDAVELRDAA